MPNYLPSSPLEPNLLSNPSFAVFLFLLGILVLIFVALLIYRNYLRRHYKIPAKYQPAVLLITVPKEAAGDKNQSGNLTETMRSQIAWAEGFLTQLGSIKPQKGFKAWLYGRHDNLALEIVAHQKLISFYVVVPEYLKQFLEQQLLAQYPSAQVEEAEDYNIFTPKSFVASANLQLGKNSMFPIKTYREFDNDPLNAITNVLSKLEDTAGAVVQILIRPAPRNWHDYGLKVVTAMQQGKPLKKVLKAQEADIFSALSKTYNFFAGPAAKKEDNQMAPGVYRLSPMEEEMIKKIQAKSSKAGLQSNIRVVVSSENYQAPDIYLHNILNSFGQYNITEYGNNFKISKAKSNDRIVSESIHRIFDNNRSFILNTEELASLYHFPLPTCETPNIRWLLARKAAPPINIPPTGIVLGKNNFRGVETLIRMKEEDRMRHFYIIGMTGTGKSVLMEEMAKQDIAEGRGVCFLDPHGTAIDQILPCIPENRQKDVVYFDPSDVEMPIGLNMLEAKTQQEMDFAASEMITIFYKLLPDPSMGGPMFEHYMRNALLLLMADQADPGTLVELGRVFTDDEYRAEKLKHTRDLLVRDFWEREYPASQRGSMASDMLSYVVSKTGRFVENEMMRNIIGQSRSGFNFRQVMDEGKILLVNLSKGKIGEMNSNLLGLIIVSKLQMAAMGRADLPENQRKDFLLYIDEFQNYTTDSMSTILAEARKYRLGLIMAHQYIGQLVKGQDTSIRDAVFGNVGTLAVFRIGAEDAEFLAKQYAPVFNEYDLINIEKFNAYVRLLIDNQASRPFNMATLPPSFGNPQTATSIINNSRQTYGHSKAEVEAEIVRRSKIGELGKEMEEEEK
ncbi:MAG: type IV secretion system DNA-binding domain-containing protein [Patescibacteria group bacterium]|nr:type IV secretion system DNA-binding domain-containing protein [Patescibacteria group bacterium]